jgi:hypothetical protein
MIKKLLSIFKKKKVENNYVAILQTSNGYIKFERGDDVKVTIYSEVPEFWYVGKILDINARYDVSSKSWRVEYYVSFKNSNSDVLKYWFLESELKKYSLQEERNSVIDMILK